MTVGRIRDDRCSVVLAVGWRAPRVSGFGLILGGQCRPFAFHLLAPARSDAALAGGGLGGGGAGTGGSLERGAPTEPFAHLCDG